MIPRIIHYVWVGPRPLPIEDHARVEKWKSLHPTWEIRAWGNADLDFNSKYIRQAWSTRAWNRVSDYTRMHALAEFGGVYLDTDVDLVRALDDLLDLDAFLGFQAGDELPSEIVNGAVLGSTPGHWLPSHIRSHFNERMDGRQNLGSYSGPGLLTEVLRGRGLMKYSENAIEIDGVTIFPKRFFYPYSWRESYSIDVIVSDTYAVHRWAESWIAPKSLRTRIHRKSISLLSYFVPFLAFRLTTAYIRKSFQVR